jgi:hypothetical protein
MQGRNWLIPTLAIAIVLPVKADLFSFSTGTPDGRIAVGARPAGPSVLQIETADDFILSAKSTIINSASFYGLMPDSVPLSSIYDVGIAIYHMFPMDSINPPSGNVPTRTNSPSDTEFTSRDSGSSTLTFQAQTQGAFSAGNSVVNGIHPTPNSTTGGEGSVSGKEVLIQTDFTTNPIVLPAGHYFFAPKVGLSGGTNTNNPTVLPANLSAPGVELPGGAGTSAGDFLWLSANGPAQFTGDLQAWTRDSNLEPDWLRVGTDIIGPGPNGSSAPKFDMAFALNGETVPEDGVAVPEPSTWIMLAGAILLLSARYARNSRARSTFKP